MSPTATATATNIQPPPNYLATLQSLVDNELIEEAQNRIKKWGLKIEVRGGKLIDTSDSTESWLHRFITSSPQMMQMRDEVRKLAKVDDEVLIMGETGTGKELIARALHGDRQGRFIGVNCAGIPEYLVESILFGHVKGSFTGATDTRYGFMIQSKGGTLFLDEVGELPLGIQAKLLRAIQERKVTPVGGDKEMDITCRIVCATHRDLTKMVQADTFRLDLFARLSTFEIQILPLWKRRDDIKPIIMSMEGGDKLVEHIEFILNESNQVRLREYLPFNVRSLQQMVKRYNILGKLPV